MIRVGVSLSDGPGRWCVGESRSWTPTRGYFLTPLGDFFLTVCIPLCLNKQKWILTRTPYRYPLCLFPFPFHALWSSELLFSTSLPPAPTRQNTCPPFLSASEQLSTLWEEITDPSKLLFVSQPQLGHCGYPGIFFFLLSCPSPILFNNLKLLLSLMYVVSSFLADSPLTF